LELGKVEARYSEAEQNLSAEANGLKIKINALKNLLQQSKTQAKNLFALIDKKEALLIEEHKL